MGDHQTLSKSRHEGFHVAFVSLSHSFSVALCKNEMGPPLISHSQPMREFRKWCTHDVSKERLLILWCIFNTCILLFINDATPFTIFSVTTTWHYATI